ncbi:MAG TPA: phosphoribosylglycinamide formyltransferase [Firmicutes bacterium]|nr:phosphoribosylglycinamide formyltransferase [Bacillota bacterium]
MKKLALLVSGSGTNMQAIMDACDSGEIKGKISVVISSNHEAYALVRAQGANIPNYVCAKKDFPSVEARDAEILRLLKMYDVDYVILAGYLGIIPPSIIKEYPNRIVNIHPALLPKYGGRNYYGINVHAAVIAAGETESGATAHFVTEEVDGGPIIRQEKLRVFKGDTPETLQRRILDQIEHPMLVGVIKDLCDDKISVVGGKVVVKD